MIDTITAKQALSDIIDFVAERQNEPPPPPDPGQHYGGISIDMPSQLASQTFITGNNAEVYLDNTKAQPYQYTIQGDVFIPNEAVRTITIITPEARWQWDFMTQKWFITGFDPDFFYKLRGAVL